VCDLTQSTDSFLVHSLLYDETLSVEYSRFDSTLCVEAVEVTHDDATINIM
jgi:hypothetical protein